MDAYTQEASSKMGKSIESLQSSLTKLRSGRANPSMLDGIKCDYYGEKMDSVMHKFDKTGAWRLPVIDENRKYLGFISKSRLLTAYRAELKEISMQD